MMLIVGLSGAIGSGKSEFSKVAEDYCGALISSFSDVFIPRGSSTRLERARYYSDGPSNHQAAIDAGKQSGTTASLRREIGERLKTCKDAWGTPSPDVVIFEDLTTPLERQCLEELAVQLGARLKFVALLGPSDLKFRYRRYISNQKINEEIINEVDFGLCNRIERNDPETEGSSENLDKDWAPNVGALRSLADLEIRNGERVSLDAFRSECRRVLKELVGDSDDNRSWSSSDLGSAEVGAPDSIARVRHLHARKIAADFLIDRLTRTSGDLHASAPSDLDKALSPLLGPRHFVDDITNQFMVRLLDAFLARPAKEALLRFRSLKYSTTDEEAVVLTNDSEFVALYSQLWTHLDNSEHEVDAYARGTQEKSFQNTLKKLDDQQFRKLATRVGPSLDEIKRNGLQLRPSQDSVGLIRDAQKEVGEGRLPILEVLKNRRILDLNDLPGSKVSHAVHDALDHVWFFDLLARKEIIRRHSNYFRGIGNPELHDLFCRESESVASISFGIRLWANQQVGFIPNTSLGAIVHRLEAAFRDEDLDEHHLQAFRAVLRLFQSPESREAQSLAFVWSNYLVELDEQRRKHGEIKYSRNGERPAPLDPWDPDYLCFFVDAHHVLCDPKNKHRDNLLRIHMALEEYLSSERALDGELFVLRVPRLDDVSVWDPRSTTLPPSRIEWMARHFGFTALRERADL